jgi:hypothetical protein
LLTRMTGNSLGMQWPLTSQTNAWLFALGSYMKITEVAHIFGPLDSFKFMHSCRQKSGHSCPALITKLCSLSGLAQARSCC